MDRNGDLWAVTMSSLYRQAGEIGGRGCSKPDPLVSLVERGESD
jgi:hypothetical protein